MLITVGASEAIAAAVLGLVEPGSEVLLLEPYFDTYAPVIAMAGAHRVSVPLVPDGRGFALDVDAVRAAITPRTRAIIVNSPHNPTGMVLGDDELRALAEVAVEADLLVISDEVYERLTFDGREHRPIATYPGMARSHGDDLQCGQDVQLHGLEDRLGLRCAGTGGRGAGGQAVPQLRRRGAVSAGGRLRAQPRGCLGGRLCATRCRPNATGWPAR